MSEIRIIHHQIQLNLEHTVAQSSVTDKFVDNLKVGQVLNAQLVHLDNKYWLMIESIKLPVSRDTVVQMGLKENQVIRMRVRSTAEPVELQIVKNKTPDRNQTNPASVVGTDNKRPTTTNQQQVRSNQTGKSSHSTAEAPDKQPVNDKVNVDKLILEARKYLSKEMVLPDVIKPDALKTTIPNPQINTVIKQSGKLSGIVDKTVGTQTPFSPNTIKPGDNPQKTEVPDTKRTSQLLGNLISQSRTVARENINKTESAAIRTTNAENNQTSTAKLPEMALNKTEQAVKSAEQLSTNLKNITAKAVPATEKQVTAKAAPVSAEQASPKAASVKTTSSSVSPGAVDGIVNTTQAAHSQTKLKLEIPVTMPDSHKFPLLSEKMDTAFQRLMPVLNSNGKSINNLFMQLQRLNQWTSDLKQSGGSNSSSQPEKLAADLKESLKDLFRYINHKDNLQTGKSVEKALRQSGTFLEKRVNAEQQAAKAGNLKNSTELTLHKDLKANLNRVLATALYNLAKINTSSTATTSTTTGTGTTTATTTAGSTATAGAGTTSETSQSGQARQLTGNTTAATNLIQSIRNRLQSFRGSKSNPDVMPELERITKEVLKNVQSALFRSQLGQLTNLRPDSAPQQWLFELPVMNNKEVDSFLIQFAEHPADEDDNDGKKDWSLILQFDIAPLGKLRAMLTWHDEKVQVRFLAEQHNTADLISKELEYFQNVLTDQGLSFEQLTVEQSMLDDINIRFSKGQSHG